MSKNNQSEGGEQKSEAGQDSEALKKVTKSLLLKLKNQEYGGAASDVKKRRQFVKDTISKEMK